MHREPVLAGRVARATEVVMGDVRILMIAIPAWAGKTERVARVELVMMLVLVALAAFFDLRGWSDRG